MLLDPHPSHTHHSTLPFGFTLAFCHQWPRVTVPLSVVLLVSVYQPLPMLLKKIFLPEDTKRE